MSDQRSTYRALRFIARYPGTRRKAFMGYLYDFSEHKLPLKRAPFRLSTISRLICEGLVTSEGPVTVTDKGRARMKALLRVPTIQRLEDELARIP